METVEERPRVIEAPGRKTIKVWSGNLQRYYRKSCDPNYYNIVIEQVSFAFRKEPN